MRAGKLLRIYLQDHDALSVITQRVIRRSRGSNHDSPLGDLLARLETGAEEDHRVLLGVMEQLAISPSRLKRAAAWGAERSGLFKLNGRLFRYSDLSRVYELEGLAALIAMRIGRWQALAGVAEKEPDLATVDFEDLIERSKEDLQSLAPYRDDAAAQAL